MAILGPYHIAALAVIGSSAAYFFTRLYRARMLFYERKKLGLVSDLKSSNPIPETKNK